MRKDGEFAAPFPYLMQSLQNFGYIADDLKVNDKGILELEYQDMRTWTLTCSCCKTEYLTANPDMPQAFADNGGVCKSCR
jgi:rRNA maturation endonuclease Nob1